MTMTTTNIEQTIAIGQAGNVDVLQALRAMWRRHRSQRRKRRDYLRLLNGPDYLLADIGLARSDVYDALDRVQL